MTTRYTVTQLARLSGVSVRTLHHYDEIGLLKPAHVGGNRYRYYGRDELLRLQDILFHRELGVPLAEIGAMLDGETDRLTVLQRQRSQLAERIELTSDLLRTIDRRIAELNGEQEMSDKEMYRGFDPKKQEEYETWLIENYGESMRERIAEAKVAMDTLGPAGRASRIAEGEEAAVPLAAAFKAGVEPEDPANHPLLARHHQWIAKMWNRACPPEAYAGLADVYLAHPDFRTNFEADAGEGFLDWLTTAMKAYAARQGA